MPGSSAGGSIVTGRSSVAFVRSVHNSQSQDLIIPQSGNMTVLTAASPVNVDIPRFCKEDYDSDDELRRGDISFSIDGGNVFS